MFGVIVLVLFLIGLLIFVVLLVLGIGILFYILIMKV